MRVHFLGVRGSTPAPGAAFVRYGGHTSCVAVEHADGSVRLVLDAGTGLTNLSDLLDERPFRGTLLLGHLHWDHTHGLPFCRAVDHPEAALTLLAPSHDGRSVEQLLADAMSPPNFPIRPDELRGRWSFGIVSEGRHQVEDFEIDAREIPHKGGRTFGYRISDGRHAVAYLSDHMPSALGPGPDGWGEYHPAALALADGVDLLIHDAQYLAEELAERGHFGHAAAEYAVALGERAGATRVAMFHHDPARTDDEVDAAAARFEAAGIAVTAAAEGSVIDLAG